MEILPKFVYLTKSKLNIKYRKDMKINIGACKKRKFRGNIEDIMDILVLELEEVTLRNH